MRKHRRRYGWKPPIPGTYHAAPRYVPRARQLAALPASVDLRASMPPVVDQGELGSCTANAMAGALGYDMIVEKALTFPVSRLFQYYNERAIEGTTSSDAGATISDTIKAAAQYGYLPEATWPYDVTQYAVKPPQSAYDAAIPDAIRDYATVAQDGPTIQAALAAGHPVLIGFTVYQSFESQAVASSGIMPMPRRGEQVMGGHAVLLCGYDQAKQVYIVRNSWGAEWGQDGYFLMPFAYVHSPQLAGDFWVVNTVPGANPSPVPPPAPSSYLVTFAQPVSAVTITPAA